jgi:hypothetical protein
MFYLGLVGYEREAGSSRWYWRFWDGARKRIGGVK